MPNKYVVMWMFVIYDLPTIDKKSVSQANKFRKNLEDLGFDRMQYSIYKKMCKDNRQYDKWCNYLTKFLPDMGEIRTFCLTDMQYGMMRIFDMDKPSIRIAKEYERTSKQLYLEI